MVSKDWLFHTGFCSTGSRPDHWRCRGKARNYFSSSQDTSRHYDESSKECRWANISGKDRTIFGNRFDYQSGTGNRRRSGQRDNRRACADHGARRSRRLLRFRVRFWSLLDGDYNYESVSIRLVGTIDLFKRKSDQATARRKLKRDNPFQSAEIILIKWKNR